MITFSQLGNLGRLGNQLFQISATVALALENNDSYGFPSWKYEDYFNLKFCFHDKINYNKIYSEPNFHYEKIKYQQDMDLKGYFQSEKYFFNYKDMIIDLLTPTHDIKAESGLCGLHVRRGDYLNLKDCYVQLGMDYYYEAMSNIGSKKYLIFSDDMSWCKDNFKGNQFEFSENNNPDFDLALMAKKCEHMIIANSSFSWWGAYLNQNKNKKIISPVKWFGNRLKYNSTKDLIPNEWIKI